MRERPVLFNSEMVQAILDGNKTQTRRAVKDYCLQQVPFEELSEDMNKTPYFRNNEWQYELQSKVDDTDVYKLKCPYGQVGDRLWVRESAQMVGKTWHGILGIQKAIFEYTADGITTEWMSIPKRLKPIKLGHKVSNGCFKELARIFLEITNIRVERLRSINHEDAKSEGCKEWHSNRKWVEKLNYSGNYRNSFHDLWQSLYGNWDKNPWVWVVEFKVMRYFS